MFLPAKTEMSIQVQLEDRKDYFLQFNFVFTPDQYIGVWWQVRTRLMDKDQAKALVDQVEPLGTIDYALIKRQVPTINTDYGLSLPVLPTTLVVGGLILLLMIGGIVLGCYMYRIRKSLGPFGKTVKKATDKPVSGLRLFLSRICKKPKAPFTPVSTTFFLEANPKGEDPPTGIHPIRMTKILQEVFPDGQMVYKYAKHLNTKDKKVQASTQVLDDSPLETKSLTSVEIKEAKL